MLTSHKWLSRFRPYLIAILGLILLIGFCVLCAKTAFRPFNYNSADNIIIVPKTQIKDTTSREKIVKEMMNSWLETYQIGTFGWIDWIWGYKLENIEVDSTLDVDSCIRFDLSVVTVAPSGLTEWSGLHTMRDGIWIQNRFMMFFIEHEEYYELRGPITLC